MSDKVPDHDRQETVALLAVALEPWASHPVAAVKMAMEIDRQATDPFDRGSQGEKALEWLDRIALAQVGKPGSETPLLGHAKANLQKVAKYGHGVVLQEDLWSVVEFWARAYRVYVDAVDKAQAVDCITHGDLALVETSSAQIDRHSVVLDVVRDKGPVTTQDVKKEVRGLISQGSVGGTLTELYRAGKVQRDDKARWEVA